jgi:hypothetical protein
MGLRHKVSLISWAVFTWGYAVNMSLHFRLEFHCLNPISLDSTTLTFHSNTAIQAYTHTHIVTHTYTHIECLGLVSVSDAFVLGLDSVSDSQDSSFLPETSLDQLRPAESKTHNYHLPFSQRIKQLCQAKYIHYFLETLIS